MLQPVLKQVSPLAKKMMNNLNRYNLRIPIPIFGLGCGVLGMALPKVSINLGSYASQLLKALEYRGYDSTGAAFQGDTDKVTLLKDVGAPSTLVKTLGIEKQSGKILLRASALGYFWLCEQAKCPTS